MSKLGIILISGKNKKMENFNNFEIKFIDDNVVLRTVDGNGFPIDIWRFEKHRLTDNEKTFISNIKSMASSMISERDKKTCKCKNCGCK